MTSPFFSVVIPLYNKKPHLERCLNSVFSQDWADFELLIIDDDSHDGSWELANKLIEERENCRIFQRNEPGPGGYAARNKGIEEANGEWIAFLDADDEWKSGLLSEYARLINQFPQSSFLGTAQEEITQRGRELDPYIAVHSNEKSRLFSLLDYASYGSMGQNPVHTSAVAAKKSILQQIDGFPAGRCKRGGDRDTWLRLLEVSDYAWSPYLGAVYYRDSVNMVTKTNPPTVTTGMDETFSRIMKSGAHKQKYGKAFSKKMKKLSNYERKGAYKRAVRDGSLTIGQMKHLFFWAEPSYVFPLYLWALLPGFLKRAASKMYLGRNK